MNTRIHLFLFFLILPVLSGLGDEIYFKDGRKINGVIRDSGGGEILVETAGGVFAFKRDQIDRIVEGSEFDNVLSQARLEELRNNFRLAIDTYQRAKALAETQEEKDTVLNGQRKAVKGYVNSLSSHDPLTNGLDDIRDIEQIKTFISDPVMLADLQSMKVSLDNKIAQGHYNAGKSAVVQKNFADAIRHYKIVIEKYPEHPLAKGLESQLAGLYNDLGEKEYQYGNGNLNKAQEAFESALTLDPNNNIAKLYLGLIAFERKNYTLTDHYLNQVSQSNLTAWQVGRLRSALNRTERELMPKPTRTVIQQPQPVVVEQEPDEDTTMLQSVNNWFNNLVSNTTALFSDVDSDSSNAVPLIIDGLKILAVIFIAFIALWYIPMNILLKDIPNRKVLYYNWRKIVRYTGLIGLILYFIDRLIREKSVKKCPACSRAIENPILFENYEFDVCPFCYNKIKPIYTFIDLITMQADTIASAKQHTGGETDESQRQQLIELVTLFIIYGKRMGAGEIRIEPGEKFMQVSFDKDGMIIETIQLELILISHVVSTVKVMSNLNIAEKRNPQNGNFHRVFLGEDIHVRVTTAPINQTEKVTLRLFDQRMVSTTVDRLGMRQDIVMQYNKVLESPNGLVLVAGPDKCGKTTLLYASLQQYQNSARQVCTVEDPIEYNLNSIDQIQYNELSGMSFADSLQSIMRRDPDVVLVGELRDLESANIAVNAAAQNRVVFAALPTIDTTKTLAKLTEVGVDEKQLSAAVQCVVSPRLVRKLCSQCKKAVQITEKEIERFGNEGRKLLGKTVYKEVGCKECNKTGYSGRFAIYEFLVPNAEIRNLIENKVPEFEMRKIAIQIGMKTLRDEGIDKILEGTTSISEILRVTPENIDVEDITQTSTIQTQANVVK